MVAAKLDHSRVLVTKFHQNRSMFKGRSAGQTQTNSAENKGPSGLQSGQQSTYDFIFSVAHCSSYVHWNNILNLDKSEIAQMTFKVTHGQQ